MQNRSKIAKEIKRYAEWVRKVLRQHLSEQQMKTLKAYNTTSLESRLMGELGLVEKPLIGMSSRAHKTGEVLVVKLLCSEEIARTFEGGVLYLEVKTDDEIERISIRLTDEY